MDVKKASINSVLWGVREAHWGCPSISILDAKSPGSVFTMKRTKMWEYMDQSRSRLEKNCYLRNTMTLIRTQMAKDPKGSYGD